MRFEFIEAHREVFPVNRMCALLNVSRSGYYDWRKRPISKREMANQELVQQIKAIHQASRENYGSPRIYQELKEQGVSCSEKRVARLMRLHAIQAKQVKCYKATTRRNRAHPVAPNLLKQHFVADYPDHTWLADISYIGTLQGWLYLAVVLDLYTRRIVGWAMSERLTGELTLKALQMALQQRRPPPGLIHHSDRGSQYTAQDYQCLLAAHGMQVSMNGVGSWYDNAPMESFFGTLKTELVHHRVYATRAQARTDLFDYIEIFYNRHRRHSSLGYLSPQAYEQQYFQNP